MSQKQPETEQETLSWEQAVCRYLEQNPDYFHRNPGLLTGLDVPHPDTGEAVSLIERQVKALREQSQGLSGQLQNLLKIARENDRLGDRLHHFGLAIVQARSLEDVLDSARDILTRDFELDGVSILLCQQPDSLKDHEIELATFLKEVFSGNGDQLKPLCGSGHDPEVLAYLFGVQALEIKSCAMVPLGGNGSTGLLALGSYDAERFQDKMGTAYLTKLGELLSIALERYLER